VAAWTAAAATAASAAGPPATLPAPRAGEVPEEGRYVGRAVPDVLLTDARGAAVPLSRLWRQRPILLVLVFSRCSGVCTPFLTSLAAAQDAVGGAADYGTLVVSIDPRDTPRDMAAWGEGLGLAGRPGWSFAVAAPADVERLAAAVGFWSLWDEERRQFDHPALLVAIAGGRVVRLLVGGGGVVPARLQEVVRELRGDFVASYPLPGKVLFRCFEYDPASGRMRLDWGFLLLLLPAGATLAATLGIFARAGRAA
jgi:protein SCO1/2